MARATTVKKSTLKGNVILVANKVVIGDQSSVSSQSAGCNFFGDIKGTPTLFVSHSFSCGLNAGSYGGRGGIGVAKSANDTLECIKNGYSRMAVYGNPLLAAASGATGSPFSIQEKNGSSPGAIAIISGELNLSKDSKIVGGYTDEYKGTPASSGGSVALIVKDAFLEGKISANGLSSDKEDSGEGGGGRISFYRVCWYNYSIPQISTFSPSVFEANPGKRDDFKEPLKTELKDYLSYIRAESGSRCHLKSNWTFSLWSRVPPN